MKPRALAGACWSLALAVSAQAGPDRTLEDCAAAVRDAPASFSGYACYWTVAQATGQWEEAGRRLEAYLALDPENYLAMAYLANVEAQRGQERASELSRRAAEGMAEQGNAYGAAYQFVGLAFSLGRLGRLDEAERAIDDAMPLAESTGDTALIARVVTRAANLANWREDYGRSLRLLARAEADVFPDGPVDVKSIWLSANGYACWALGRLDEAMELYRREADLLHEQGNLFGEALPRRNMTFIAGHRGLSKEERRQLAREALDAARTGRNRTAEASTHVDLTLLTEGEERLEHARQALELARTLGDVKVMLAALRSVALASTDSDPEAAFRALDEAADLARREGYPSDVARAAVSRARERWKAGPREQAITEYLVAFDAIEATRNLQPDDVVRAMRFGAWGRPYSELISRLLSDPRSDDDLGIAFAVAERRRARLLLDRLDAARATAEVASDGEVARRRADTLREISGVQRSLVEGGLTDTQVDEALEKLTSLELEESELRDELARSDPSFAALYQPTFPSLQAVRGKLEDDQALLYYQIWETDHENDSWLLTITNRAVRTYRLPDCTGLRSAVRLFLGLFGTRDGSEEVAATRLYADFLFDALADLPAGIERLIVVPGESLNFVPFSALRAGAGEPPLATRYEITVVPSATTWLSWSDGSPADALPAIAFVDPDLPAIGTHTENGGERSSVLTAATRLGSLAQARREGRAAVRHLGEGSVSLEGREATESYVKQAALARYGVIHFAAHALVDEDNPERSAVVLAPGGDEEDGLLQIREIVDLDLSGQVVVLSACRSAYGRLVGGEGVMDLARAFFQAGASTVVGSLWPLRDEEAAELFDDFYRHLGRGESVAGAVAAAKRRQLGDGAPAAAWAGVVVLGNGDAVPHPGPPPGSRMLAWVIAVAVVLGVATYTVIRRGRHEPPGCPGPISY